MRNKFRPFIAYSPDDPVGGELDLNDLIDDPLGPDPTPDPDPDPAPDPAPPYDLRTREQEIREEERRKFEPQLTQLQKELQQYQTQRVEADEDEAEMEAIAELASSLNPDDIRQAERRRMALAEKRVAKAFTSQYGPQLLSSGVAMAVQDGRAKFKNEPAEMQPYIENTIIELGLQGQVPEHLIKPIQRLAYGAAHLEGKAPTKAVAPRVVKTTGSEQITFTTAAVPAQYQNDASEFEKHFGKAALTEALKEAELG